MDSYATEKIIVLGQKAVISGAAGGFRRACNSLCRAWHPSEIVSQKECLIMAATQALNLRWAGSPFYFKSAAHLIRIGRERAMTLGELATGLQQCPDGAIFQHTFHTLQEHHYLREGFSNDFAHWAFAACNEVGLAERLSSVDVREFTSVEALRERIVEIMERYLQDNPRSRDRVAMEQFDFG